MSHASLGILSIVVALVPMVACGVGGAENLFGESTSGESTSGEGGAGATGASSSSAEGGAGNAGAAPDGGAGPGPGSASSTASSASVASSSSSSSRASSSSSSGGMGFSVACGGVDCPTDGQGACCWDFYQLNGPPQGACVKGPPDGDECDTEYHPRSNSGAEARIECQLPSHCSGGDVCCGDRVVVDPNSAYYAGTQCQAFCAQEDRVLCSPLDPSSACPSGTVCVPSTLLPPGYHICSGN